MYTKSFMCEIIIYPDFHRDQYAGYMKEQINKWISDCFRAYTASFELKIIQNGTVLYSYDSETDQGDINLKKLWLNQLATYTIFISGEGIIFRGAKQIAPPLNIVDATIEKITFRYKESSDIFSPIMLAFGKTIGLPMKYSRDDTEGEEWNSGFCEKDIYCPSLVLDISCNPSNYDRSLQYIKEMTSFNSGETAEINADPYGLNIRVATPFHLMQRHKVKFLSALNKLCCLLVEDDGIVISEFNMDFISEDNSFSLESYLYDEKDGKIVVRNITV